MHRVVPNLCGCCPKRAFGLRRDLAPRPPALSRVQGSRSTFRPAREHCNNFAGAPTHRAGLGDEALVTGIQETFEIGSGDVVLLFRS